MSDEVLRAGRHISEQAGDPDMDFEATVNKFLSQLQDGEEATAQDKIRTYIKLAPSFLILDTSLQSGTDNSIEAWARGFDRILDVVVDLHVTSRLAYETVEAIARAAEESWDNSLTLNKDTDLAQEKIKGIAERLRGLFDLSGSSTYQGRTIALDLM